LWNRKKKIRKKGGKKEKSEPEMHVEVEVWGRGEDTQQLLEKRKGEKRRAVCSKLPARGGRGKTEIQNPWKENVH